MGLTRSIFGPFLDDFSNVIFRQFLPFHSIYFSSFYKFYKYLSATHPDLAGARIVFGSKKYAALSLSKNNPNLVAENFAKFSALSRPQRV